ncbi:MAG: D-cysteine desulfhydrase [Reyranellaceae bacterium]
MQLGKYPRAKLAQLPTPLEFMPRLTKALGGPKLWVKRDDCTGLATGGNKTRKLEFLLGEALAQGADTLITLGAVQSNHVRQTAAAAAKYGLKCEIVLEKRLSQTNEAYERNGNILLDKMLGANLRYVPGGTAMMPAAEAVADEIRGRGGRPYVIPGGGSNPVGALGYIDSAQEILRQSGEMGFAVDTVVVATGSTGTQAGLVVGFEAAQSGVDVLGICVRQPGPVQEEAVFKLVEPTADFVGLKHAIARERVMADGGYVGEGYGVPTTGMIEALDMAAKLEGLLLDPVYSGKAMAGLIDLARKGKWRADQSVVFIHTGGQAGLFAYEPVLGGPR